MTKFPHRSLAALLAPFSLSIHHRLAGVMIANCATLPCCQCKDVPSYSQQVQPPRNKLQLIKLSKGPIRQAYPMRACRTLRLVSGAVGGLCQLITVPGQSLSLDPSKRLHGPILHNPPGLKPDHPVAPALHDVHVMGRNHQYLRCLH